MQTAEWDNPESDLENDIFDMEESEDAAENKDSWTGALLKTSLGGFLHGLTGTKVCPRCVLKKACWLSRCDFRRDMHRRVLLRKDAVASHPEQSTLLRERLSPLLASLMHLYSCIPPRS